MYTIIDLENNISDLIRSRSMLEWRQEASVENGQALRFVIDIPTGDITFVHGQFSKQDKEDNTKHLFVMSRLELNNTEIHKQLISRVLDSVFEEYSIKEEVYADPSNYSKETVAYQDEDTGLTFSVKVSELYLLKYKNYDLAMSPDINKAITKRCIFGKFNGSESLFEIVDRKVATDIMFNICKDDMTREMFEEIKLHSSFYNGNKLRPGCIFHYVSYPLGKDGIPINADNLDARNGKESDMRLSHSSENIVMRNNESIVSSPINADNLDTRNGKESNMRLSHSSENIVIRNNEPIVSSMDTF